MKAGLMYYEEIITMSLRKRTANGHNQCPVDIKQLTVRLKTIAKQRNIEIIQLALQSIIEELEEKQGTV